MSARNGGYVHGYGDREHERLLDQANVLVELLHHDTKYPAGARVLEVGCGVGAQTVTLVARSPEAEITCVDISAHSLLQARTRVLAAGHRNAIFCRGDLHRLPFPDASFDHAFVCFVLEHLADPTAALSAVQSKVRPGGSFTVIEGDHGSAYFHPRSSAAARAIQCLVDLQAGLGGDALIGRRLFPLMAASGLTGVRVTPRMVYADATRPEMVEGFTRNTFAAMVEGVGDEALAAGLVDRATWERGIADLYRTAESDGVFCYSFFKGVGYVPADG